jgi:hypothetical protein
MHHLFNVLNHLQPIRRWAKQAKVRIQLDAETFQLGLRGQDASMTLIPKFMIKSSSGAIAYVNHFTERCRFVGWLPYQVKNWGIGTDKTAFKRHCERAGLRTPSEWIGDEPPAESFLVKPRLGSWGDGIRGPFHAEDLRQQRITLGTDVYLEEFILGRPTKIWYWNESPVAIETIKLPTLYADGRRSLSEMARQPRGSFDLSHDLSSCTQVLAWQGWTAESIPPAGVEVVLGFLYASIFDPVEVLDRDSLANETAEFVEELARVGRALVPQIPEEIRANTLYTVDGVIDKDGALSLLEMNCHPVVHPNTYPAMLRDCAGHLAQSTAA